MSLTSREEYIKTFFIPVNKKPDKVYMSDEEVEKIVKKISEIGDMIGFVGNEKSKQEDKHSKRSHKYDVWVAKEAKKDLIVLDRFNDIRLIMDWVISTKADIFKYSFIESYDLQKDWHNEKFQKFDINDINIPNVDNNRIIYRCEDKEHFFYLLTESDLKYEGKLMSSCVGKSNYKNKVKNLDSIILSVRNSKNIPQVTIEIDVKKASVIQQFGYDNAAVEKQHFKNIYDFMCLTHGFKDMENKEILQFLNPQFSK